MTEDEDAELVPTAESLEVELRKSRWAELVLAVLSGGVVVGAVSTDGWVRLVLAVIAGLLAGLLLWSLFLLAFIEAFVRLLKAKGFLRNGDGR